MEVLNIQHDGFHSAQIIGEMQISYEIDSNQIKVRNGFKMLLVKTQTGLKIALFDWMLK